MLVKKLLLIKSVSTTQFLNTIYLNIHFLNDPWQQGKNINDNDKNKINMNSLQIIL